MAPSPISEPAPSPLPQYGLGSDVHFKSLVKNNRFLYRVYTPKERALFADEADPYFVAPKFDELYARTPVEVTSARIIDPSEASYSDVARHMDWTTRSSSVLLSTSFSFAWSIWEALRRYHQGMKKDVEIAVIDASALSGRAATAVEMLEKSSPEERNQQYSKWHKFSRDSQSVLVYGFIPAKAVLSSVPLLGLLERLPSYLLRTKAQIVHGNPLDHVAWNYADKKQTYRQFCQDMSTRFFNTSQELRFRDATGGSLRLALTFLRPWFYHMIVQDFNLAVSTLRDLAIIIAHWGGQWWARDHAELNRILDSMTFTLGEELLQRIKRQDAESSKLHDTVETLERIIRAHDTERLVRPSQLAAESCQCASSPITPLSSPKFRPRRTISMSIPASQTGHLPFHTPITPPESRRNSWSLPKQPPNRPTILDMPFSPREVSPLDGIWTPSLTTLSQSLLSPVPASPPTPTSTALAPEEESTTAKDDQRSEAPATPVATQATRLESEDSDRPSTVGYPPTPPLEYEAPTTPINLKAKLVSQGKGVEGEAAASFLPTPPQESDAPRTPGQSQKEQLESGGAFHRARIVSALPTPPLDSLFTEGFRARTLSDVSSGPSGLRILIPNISTRLVFPSSPTDTLRTTQPDSDSAVSSPRTLALPSPLGTPITLGSTPLHQTSLGSPFRLVNSEELPPLPASPAESWGSASTLPTSPTIAVGSVSSKLPKLVIPPTGSSGLASASATFEEASPTTPTSRSSLSEDGSRSPTSESALGEEGQAKGKEPEVAIRYVPPQPGMSILAPPFVQTEEGQEDIQEFLARRRRHNQILDTASTIVTGFLVGAFVTLFLVSAQRKTLLYLT